jgi:predicted type IV restriction endonuclease
MLMPERRKIGEILVQLKAMSRSDVDRVLEAMEKRSRRQKFGQTACDMGLLDEEHIFVALAVQMNLFPGVERLSVDQILRYLQTAEAGV